MEFHQQHTPILQHLIMGEIKRGKSYGIHFFHNGLHRIDEITKPANTLGVWEATIQVRHPKTNAWVSKKKPSTFFPKAWTQEMLLIKLEEAFQAKQKVQPYKFLGKTSCGIPVCFLIKDKLITSCFPIYT